MRSSACIVYYGRKGFHCRFGGTPRPLKLFFLSILTPPSASQAILDISRRTKGTHIRSGWEARPGHDSGCGGDAEGYRVDKGRSGEPRKGNDIVNDTARKHSSPCITVIAFNSETFVMFYLLIICLLSCYRYIDVLYTFVMRSVPIFVMVLVQCCNFPKFIRAGVPSFHVSQTSLQACLSSKRSLGTLHKARQSLPSFRTISTLSLLGYFVKKMSCESPSGSVWIFLTMTSMTPLEFACRGTDTFDRWFVRQKSTECERLAGLGVRNSRPKERGSSRGAASFVFTCLIKFGGDG